VLRPDNPKDNPDFMASLAVLQAAFEHSIFGAKSAVQLPLLAQRRFCSLLRNSQANVVFAWHGCPSQFVENVCRDGPRALRFTDGGFFATGSYTALELDYATRYAMMHPPSDSGEYASRPTHVCGLHQCTEYLCCYRYPVILFAVFLSSAYVVTLRDYPPDDPDRPQTVSESFQRFPSRFRNRLSVGFL
jgi:hypothetical protein